MLSHGECGHSLVTLVDRHIYILIYEVYQNSVASPGAAPFQWSRVSVHLSCVRSIFVVLKASSLELTGDWVRVVAGRWTEAIPCSRLLACFRLQAADSDSCLERCLRSALSPLPRPPDMSRSVSCFDEPLMVRLDVSFQRPVCASTCRSITFPFWLAISFLACPCR